MHDFRISRTVKKGPEKSSISDDQVKKMLAEKIEEDDREEHSWFSPLLFSLSQDIPKTLTVRFPHYIFFRWFSETGREKLEEASRELFGNMLAFQYIWKGKQGDSMVSSPSFHRHEDTVFPKRWDDFFPGGRNRETLFQFRQALTLSPSFILIHGPSGTGKSHLLSAAASDLRSRYPGLPVRLIHGQDLAFLLEHGEDTKSLENCSALLIDDIHLISDDTRAQRALAAVMDHMEHRAFFIATMTDHTLPLFIPELYDRLCSYLVLELTEPDLDVRMRFALLRMEKAGLPEDRETALLLSRHCLKLRHLGGVISSIRNSYERQGTLPSREDILTIMRSSGTPQPLDVDSILAIVASRYGCTSQDLIKKTRNTQYSLARQIAMYLCRELLGESYPSLGLIFGGRDHSTIMYAIKKIEKIQVTNKDVNMVITELTKQCKKGRSEGTRSGKRSFLS